MDINTAVDIMAYNHISRDEHPQTVEAIQTIRKLVEGQKPSTNSESAPCCIDHRAIVEHNPTWCYCPRCGRLLVCP